MEGLLLLVAATVLIGATWYGLRFAKKMSLVRTYNRYFDLRREFLLGDPDPSRREELEPTRADVMRILGPKFDPAVSGWQRLSLLEPNLRSMVVGHINAGSEEPADLEAYAEAILAIEAGAFPTISPSEWLIAARRFIGDATGWRLARSTTPSGREQSDALDGAEQVSRRFFVFAGKGWFRPTATAVGGPSNDRVLVSRFGAFGPGTGLVVALDERIRRLDEPAWRRFATMMLGGAMAERPSVNEAADRIQDSAAGMDGTFLIQAKRWADTEIAAHIASLPDAWFDGSLPDGRTAVPSGVKSICAERIGLAVAGLAALHFAAKRDVAVLYGPVEIIVPFGDVVARGPVVTHATLIEPFADIAQ